MSATDHGTPSVHRAPIFGAVALGILALALVMVILSFAGSYAVHLLSLNDTIVAAYAHLLPSRATLQNGIQIVGWMLGALVVVSFCLMVLMSMSSWPDEARENR